MVQVTGSHSLLMASHSSHRPTQAATSRRQSRQRLKRHRPKPSKNRLSTARVERANQRLLTASSSSSPDNSSSHCIPQAVSCNIRRMAVGSSSSSSMDSSSTRRLQRACNPRPLTPTLSLPPNSSTTVWRHKILTVATNVI